MPTVTSSQTSSRFTVKRSVPVYVSVPDAKLATILKVYPPADDGSFVLIVILLVDGVNIVNVIGESSGLTIST